MLDPHRAIHGPSERLQNLGLSALPEHAEDTGASFEHHGQDALPFLSEGGKEIRLILGSAWGQTAPVKTFTDTFYADAVLSVQDQVVLPDDSAALVSSEGLLGGNFVELVPGGSLDNLAAGDEILDTQGAVSVISLMMKFAGGGSDDAPADPAGAVE